jgi:hypothetical protein
MKRNGGQYETQVGRRDFLKATTLAGAAVALPTKNLTAQNADSPMRTPPQGRRRKVLFISDSTASYEKLMDSIRAVRDFDFEVRPVQINYQKPQEIPKAVQSGNADILFMCLPRIGITSAHIAELLGEIDTPVILLPPNSDLIMIEADLAATFRMRGVPAMLANSEAHALELLKIAAIPRILEGKRALIFGRPFESSSVPARNLSEDYIYKRTGVRIAYRPIDELKPLLESVDEARARREMERWKREAAQIVEPVDQAILDASRLYVLLRSIVDRERLSAVSIDCLSFSFGRNPTLPYPCLAFTRLRDEGITAACEADVCAMLTSMFLQEISRKPSYFCNVSSVNARTSTTVLRHCVAPLRLMGFDAAQLPYRLRDYHGMGRGVVPEVDYPAGVEVTLGGFGKDLKSMSLWPGRIQVGIEDRDRPSFPNMPSSKMRMFCSNRVEIKIKEVERFLQSITGIHHVMIAGSHMDAIRAALLRMNVAIVGPVDSAAPEI